MARKLTVTNVYSDAWNWISGFCPDVDAAPEVAQLKALGVDEVCFRIGCTARTDLFFDLEEVVARKGVSVDVIWLNQVRGLCESMIPAIDAQLQSVVERVTEEPDAEDPEGILRDDVAAGNFLLRVSARFQRKPFASVDLYFPATEAPQPNATA